MINPPSFFGRNVDEAEAGYEASRLKEKFQNSALPVTQKELARHLKNVLIAFAHPEPSNSMYEAVSDASIFLQKLDPQWRKACASEVK